MNKIIFQKFNENYLIINNHNYATKKIAVAFWENIHLFITLTTN